MHATREPADATSPLIVGLRAGDPDAIARCYRSEAPALLLLAYRLTGSSADAEDVVHDVFVGLPEAIRRYDERGRFSAWLRQVTARVALMQRRRTRQRREESVDDTVVTAISRDVPSDAVVVEDASDALPHNLRDVFVLKVLEGYSHAEIGAMLGISAGASEVRLVRAMRQLRTQLGGTP